MGKIAVAKSSLDNKGVSRLSVENFLPYKAEKFRMGTLSVSLFSRFGKFNAPKGCHDFLSNFFLSHTSEKIR